MKKITLYLFVCLLLLSNSESVAQTGPAWLVGGNNFFGFPTNRQFGTNTNHGVIFETNSIQRGVLTAGGFWGIGNGTFTPAAPLHVNRNNGFLIARFSNSATTGDRTALIDVQNGQGVLWRYGVGGTGNGLGINNGQFYIERLGIGSAFTIATNGNVGIGTIAPTRRLHIVGPTPANANTGQLGIENPSGQLLLLGRAAGYGFIQSHNSQPLAINPLGNNVGIGTTTPLRSLHVVGPTPADANNAQFQIATPTGLSLLVGRAAGYGFIQSHNSQPLAINPLGNNVGIGTTSPAVRLHVRQDIANRAIEMQHESDADFWTVGVGTSTKNLRLEFNGVFKGQFSSVNGLYSASDVRLKEEIEPVTQVLDKLMELKPSKYYYKSSRATAKNKSIGFVAQEVEKVFPELVAEEDEGYKTLNYGEFSVISIKAIQEQQQTIQEQRQQITSLEERLIVLENALKAFSIGNLNLPGDPNQVSKAVSGISLEQNYPNNFNESTTIRYTIPADANALILLFDEKGNLVKSLKAPASGQVSLNAAELKSGTYIYTLVIDGVSTASRKLVITK
jgi:hypothetical protein